MAVRPLRGLSICTGVGGLELGLHDALGGNYVPVCYVEGEAYAARVLVARMADKTLGEAPIWSDVRTFNPKPWRGCVDIISAGIPCQPWSVAGRRQGAKDERHLWAPVASIIKDLRPKYVVIENVPGLLAKNGLEPIWRDLLAMGFEVEAGIFSAAQVGAPHLRKRVFLLAHAQHVPGGRAEHAFGKSAGQKTVHTGGHGTDGNVADTKGDRREARASHPMGTIPPIALRHAPLPANPFINAWDVEPTICGKDNGLTDRLDRLRALGNAVVPQCAAYALKTLLQESEA